MKPVLTPAEAAALDRLAEASGIAVADLMERAGLAVARACVDLTGGTYGRRAVVVCGKGNNGGDGLVAARQLDRWGMGATAVMVTDVSSAPDGIESRCGPMSSTPPRGPIVWDTESGERGAQRSSAVPGASGSSRSGSSGTPVGARSPQPTSAAMNRRRVAFMDDRRAWESWQTV